MDMSRCDECCEKLDGVNGDTVYTSTTSSTLLANGNYTGNINNVTNPSSGGFTVTSGIVSGVTSC